MAVSCGLRAVGKGLPGASATRTAHVTRTGAYKHGDASIGTATDAVRAREGTTRGERVPPLTSQCANGTRRLGRTAEAQSAEQTRASGAAQRRAEDAWRSRSVTGALGRREAAALG